MKRLLFVALTGVLLAGCAGISGAPRLDRPPDVVICNRSKSDIMDKIVSTAISKGYNVKNTNNYQVVVAKPITDAALRFLASSRYDVNPEERIIWTFAGYRENCTLVSAVIQSVTNPGSAFEKITDRSTGAAGSSMQTWMSGLKREMENQTP